jgi:hypothetical protein
MLLSALSSTDRHHHTAHQLLMYPLQPAPAHHVCHYPAAPQAILSFNLPAAAAAAHVAALHKLKLSAASAAAGPGWCQQVNTAAHTLLSALVGSRQQQQQAPSQQALWRASVALFTVGEVALLRAAKVPSSLTLLVQALTSGQLLPGSVVAPSQAGPSQVSRVLPGSSASAAQHILRAAAAAAVRSLHRCSVVAVDATAGGVPACC